VKRIFVLGLLCVNSALFAMDTNDSGDGFWSNFHGKKMHIADHEMEIIDSLHVDEPCAQNVGRGRQFIQISLNTDQGLLDICYDLRTGERTSKCYQNSAWHHVGLDADTAARINRLYNAWVDARAKARSDAQVLAQGESKESVSESGEEHKQD
jgi:hypothetical protein